MPGRGSRRAAALAILLAVSACAPATPPGSPRTAAAVPPGTVLAEDQFPQALARTGGRLVVVQVFSAACGPCLAEALELTDKQPAWKAMGVAVIGLGMDPTPAESRQFYESTGGRVDYPLYHAPWFAQRQAVAAMPAVFVYSAAGKLLFRSDAAAAGAGTLEVLERKLAELAESVR